MLAQPAFDVAVIGGGAAGLAAAIFAARRHPRLRIAILDGAKKLGAKILVSGGGRCNVTNRVVTAADFRGGNPHIIRRVLGSLPVEQTVAFFHEIGVSLHEEEYGKLFPDSNSARTVLDALLAEAARLGVHILTGRRITSIAQADLGFLIESAPPTKVGSQASDTAAAPIQAACIVLATGGMSLPKTGSDGTGYGLAQKLGHALVPPTPALVPLVLSGDFHRGLAGVSQEVVLTVRTAGAKPVRIRGPMLWTHFGISGPAAMDASGLWHLATLEARPVALTASLLPAEEFESAEARFLALVSHGPKMTLKTALATMMPARVGEAVLAALKLAGHVPMAHLSREARRKLIAALLDWPLPVNGSRGYSHAEVTAGGVPLEEINPATMQSRVCPGLYLVGEILDVDGRIGGFNFQWAWSSGHAAGKSLAATRRGALGSPM